MCSSWLYCRPQVKNPKMMETPNERRLKRRYCRISLGCGFLAALRVSVCSVFPTFCRDLPWWIKQLLVNLHASGVRPLGSQRLLQPSRTPDSQGATQGTSSYDFSLLLLFIRRPKRDSKARALREFHGTCGYDGPLRCMRGVPLFVSPILHPCFHRGFKALGQGGRL